MDDEQLIECERAQEILYNKGLMGYRLPERKEAAWAQVASCLGTTEDQCSKRWQSLRERNSRELRKQDAPSGSGEPANDTWPLYRNMAFLKEFIKSRPGKHKNVRQETVLIQFMENHPEIADGFIKGDKVKVDALWAEVVAELNKHGPPHKDISGWKKVWMDWRAVVRKKVAHNNKEAGATGGGPFNKHVLTPTEDAIARLCKIHTTVGGVPKSKDCGATDDETLSETSSEDDNRPSTSGAAASSRCRRSEPPVTDCLKSNIAEQTTHMKNLVNGFKGNIEATVYVSGAVESLCEAVTALTTAIKEGNAEEKRHHLHMERLRQTENELKLKEIELAELKMYLKYNSQKNNSDSN